MKRKQTVSIAIPAYNEEANIKQLLISLVSQKRKNYILKEIIVISDGSTDDTVKEAKSVKNHLITVIEGRRRSGKSNRLNEIFKRFSGDILFLLDADVCLKDNRLFEYVMKNSSFEKDGIVTVRPQPLPGTSFFEKSINYSVDMINYIRVNWDNGRNFLSFRGTFFGLWGPFAKKIHLHPRIVSQDAYLFFLARSKGYKSKYFSNKTVYYKSPTHFSDHVSQSHRYSETYKELDSSFISSSYEHAYIPNSVFMHTLIPKKILIFAFIRYFFKNPVYFLSYCLISIAVKLNKNKRTSHQWDLAVSTKRLTHERFI